MNTEQIKKDIDFLKKTKNFTGSPSVKIYRTLGAFKQVCKKYTDFPGFKKNLEELEKIDILKGENVDKLTELDEIKKNIEDNLSIISDFLEAKKTLKACINTCKKYELDTPDSVLYNGVTKKLTNQKKLFKNRLSKSEELLEKSKSDEISMVSFIYNVENIKKAILGTIKELKQYGLFKKEIKEEISDTNKKTNLITINEEELRRLREKMDMAQKGAQYQFNPELREIYKKRYDWLNEKYQKYATQEALNKEKERKRNNKEFSLMKTLDKQSKERYQKIMPRLKDLFKTIGLEITDLKPSIVLRSNPEYGSYKVFTNDGSFEFGIMKDDVFLYNVDKKINKNELQKKLSEKKFQSKFETLIKFPYLGQTKRIVSCASTEKNKKLNEEKNTYFKY